MSTVNTSFAPVFVTIGKEEKEVKQNKWSPAFIVQTGRQPFIHFVGFDFFFHTPSVN